MSVAQTILNQLGGNRFAVMTGAKQFVGGVNSLTFSIPASKGINKVKITLNGLDLYDMQFGHFSSKTLEYKVVKLTDNVEADILQAEFTHVTGLLTKL